MNRTGLLIAFAIAVVAGLVFGLYPGLDLEVARYFHGFVDRSNNTFALRIYPPMMKARDAGLWIGTILVAPAVCALIVKLVRPRRRMLISGRATVFLIATMALGPGLLVNVLLKDHWGRPRPIDVTQFGGDQTFVAWWDPRGDCPSNCSFVSGDVAGAVWTIAPAALAPPHWRACLYGGARTRRGDGDNPRDGRRAFSVGCNIRRHIHLFDRLDHFRDHLSLAPNAVFGRGRRADARARNHARLQFGCRTVRRPKSKIRIVNEDALCESGL